ncbi:MAG: type I secretion system permease/ATPase [Pseudomonadota bacterium]
MGLAASAAFFSVFVNLLMLTGPLYMLNLYDRVLGSRSVSTLVALSLIVLFLYAMMGLLDLVRGRIMGRVGARFQAKLERRVFSASLVQSGDPEVRRVAVSGSRDLESLQRLLTSPTLMSLFDLPFTPLFLFVIFVFHPWLGILALVGGGMLVVFALINRIASKKPLEVVNATSQQAEIISAELRGDADIVHALGMREAAFSRWQDARRKALKATVAATDTGRGWGTVIKTFRLFLQSAMLGLGAYLVLQGQMTGGAMIAGSILLGRALAPVEGLVTQWELFERAREGWDHLTLLLTMVPPEARRTELPTPAAKLVLDQVTIIPPGANQAALRMLSFSIEPGQAVGVIGNSGAGKSTLARAITGLWPPAGGSIRLDGATLHQYDPDTLGRYIGYLPQRVSLFDGTIKENIARLADEPDDAAVVKAALQAGAHEMILDLPDGYDTHVTSAGGRLSGGQVQRIGLARAMYGDPVLVVLDEPNSNLDNEGSSALNAAIRTMKSENRCVLIMAHRPAAIQECDMVLMIHNGMRRAFGPRDEVLREVLHNHQNVIKPTGLGGVT